MKFSSFIFLTGLVALLSGAPVNGQVTRVVERQASFADLSTTDAEGNLLVTGDLLTNASPDANFPFSQNNDLLASAPGVSPGANDGEVSQAGNGPYTFTFITPVEITQIDVYTAWRDFRAGQNLEISLSTDGVNFTSLIDYNEESTGGEVVLSSITDEAGVPLGSGITAIRFAPAVGANNGSGAIFREIDVIGTADPIPADQAVFSVERQTSFADLSTTDAAGNLLVTGDLLTTATPDVAFPANQNNDLLASAPDVAPGVNDSEGNQAGAGPYTYTFASLAEITQIDVYSAWRDARAGQNLAISLSTDGVNFEPLLSYNVDSTGNEVVLTTITRANGDPIGTDIMAIRFTPGTGINGSGGVFREIDVIGTSDAPPFLKGDVDLNGFVEFADIPAFIQVLIDQGNQREADADCNGEVEFADIPAFIQILIEAATNS